MSGSSKPPAYTPSTERVARILIDAEVLGDQLAARKHRIHYRTVENYRRQYRDAPLVDAEMKALRAEIREGWIDEARDGLRELLQLTLAAARRPKAKLRDRTDAFRRVHEAIAVFDVLNDAERDDDGGGGAPPEAAVQGEGPEGGGDPPPRDEDDPD